VAAVGEGSGGGFHRTQLYNVLIFTEETTEAQKGKKTFLRTHSKSPGELRLESGMSHYFVTITLNPNLNSSFLGGGMFLGMEPRVA
jgi:hypothetical protein